MNTTTIDLDARQTRTLEIRQVDGEKREITGIGVPYDTEITLSDFFESYRESFAPGSVDATGAILRYAHREPIGRITATRETPDGLEITGVISQTERGNEVWQLVKDSVLTKMSIGFDPIEKSVTEDADGTQHVKWLKVAAREFSVVEFPAYDDAQITSHRNKQDTPEQPVKETPEMDTTQITDRLDTLERSLAVLEAPKAPAVPVFESFGAYVAAYKRGDDNAKQFRDAVTSKQFESINRPVWLGDLSRRMEAKQRLKNTFSTVPLPDKGMTMEYALRANDSTIKVGKQATEGARLAQGKPGTWTVGSAPVNTYGGVTDEITRQVIERTSSPAILTEIFTDLAFQYATAIESDVRAAFTQLAADAEKKPAITLTENLAALSVNTLMDVLVELDDIYDQTPYIMDGILVSPEVFKALTHLDYSPKALQLAGAPDRQLGTLTLGVTGNANIGPVTVQRVPGWQGAHIAAYTKEALTTSESSGAPLRLEDEDITTLTKQFAVYGYAAVYSSHPDLIKAIKLGE